MAAQPPGPKAFVLADPYPRGKYSRRVFRALIGALCPPAPAPRSVELLDRIETSARRLMRYMHPTIGRGLWLVVLLLDLAPLLLWSARRRLHSLDDKGIRNVIGRLSHSRWHSIRTAIIGVRGMILSAYFDQPEVHDAIGYRPVEFIKQRLELRDRLLRPAPVAAE
jgi:hypothetical protein